MKRAIAIPYSVDQHEPSRPLKQLVCLVGNRGFGECLEPTYDLAANEEMLKKLFCETVYDGASFDEITVREGDEWDFGDIVVEAQGDFFLFLTLTDE